MILIKVGLFSVPSHQDLSLDDRRCRLPNCADNDRLFSCSSVRARHEQDAHGFVERNGRVMSPVQIQWPGSPSPVADNAGDSNTNLVRKIFEYCKYYK